MSLGQPLGQRIAVAFLLALALALGSCTSVGAPSDDVRVQIIVPSPTRVGPATVDVLLSKSDGSPISGAKVRVRGDMSHAGMVPVVRTASEVAPGRYAVDRFEFTMAGDWVISVEGELAGGKAFAGSLDVRGVEP